MKEKNQIHTRQRLLVYGFFLLLLLAVTVFAGKLAPYDPYEQNLSCALQAPGREHLLGTDRYGRDLLSRILVGGQTTIFSSLFLVLLISGIGTGIGLICGYLGGWLDGTVMRIADVFLAFPGMIFAMAAAGILGGGTGNAILSLAMVSWPKYAYLARSQTRRVKEEPFIETAKLSGCRTGQILLRHILPNIAGTILVTAVLDIGTMMMELAGLSFLGLGAAAPTPEWGSMMSDGRSLLQIAPWVILAPGFAIFLTIIVCNLFGDTVRDALGEGTER